MSKNTLEGIPLEEYRCLEGCGASESLAEHGPDALHELSDASFQERVWLRGEGGEVSSPSEAVNQLFDDSGLGDLLEGGLVFSEKADATLRRLGEHMSKINFDQPVEDLLADRHWLKLRELSLQARHEVESALRSE